MPNDLWTPPTNWNAGTSFTEAKAEQEITDDIHVLSLAIDGDLSVSTIKHRHLSGTLVARPVFGEPGRIYFATDLSVNFFDDGSQWVPLGVQIVNRNLALVTIVNTVVETSIYTFTIPAGTLGATGGFRATLGGDLFFNAVGTITIRVKLGVTTVLTTNSFSGDQPFASPRRWRMELLCMNSAAAAQKWIAQYHVGPQNAGNFAIALAATAVAGDDTRIGVGRANSTENTALDRTLNITVQWSVASVGLTFTKELAVLELLPAV